MKNADEAYRGDIAHNYENDRIVETIWDKEQNFINDYFSQSEKGSSVLDIPVGTGRFIDLYLKKEMKVIGIDISDDMLSEARNKFRDNENIKLEQGEVRFLPLNDASVDHVVCWRLVHLLNSNDLDKMISEFNRVCHKEIIIQIYESLDTLEQPLFLRKLKSIYSMARTTFIDKKKDRASWSKIKNFVHDDVEMNSLFKKHNLTLKKTFILDDPINREKIYVVHRVA
jgi:ubiquinone/menaquinone biosynthesis C-methylase UbiE